MCTAMWTITGIARSEEAPVPSIASPYRPFPAISLRLETATAWDRRPVNVRGPQMRSTATPVIAVQAAL